MTWQPTDQEQIVLHYTAKLLVLMSGMAIFSILGSIALWRLGWIAPTSRFSAVFLGVPIVGFYVAMVLMVFRLRRRVRHGAKSTTPEERSGRSE